MSFKDFILNTDFTIGEITVTQIAITLLLSFGLGLIVFFVYRITYQGVSYSKMFNVSLIGLSLITSGIIMAITSNIIISLGMVGALSIVRFRTAIKDPNDIVYMYWAIAVGIIVGANLVLLAVVFTVVVGIVLFALSKISAKNQLYLFIVEYEKGLNDNAIYNSINKYCRKHSLKSKASGEESYEITLELRSNYDISKLVDNVEAINGVKKAALVSYDGNLAL